MKESPILFSGEMVRAILAGRKTQTRMVVKDVSADCELFIDAGDGFWQQCYRDNTGAIHSKSWLSKCPYGKPGDRLWVRERHARIPGMVGMHAIHYFADGPMPTVEQRHDAWLLRSYPSIHMPRWASRITLEIVAVRVERLQDISEGDAMAEGLKTLSKDGELYKWGIPDRDGLPGNDDFGWHWKEWESDPRAAFHKLWQSIHGPDSWEKNPFVWVIEFKVI